MNLASLLKQKHNDLLAAFEAYQKTMTVSVNTRRRLKMCFHIFRQYVLSLKAKQVLRDDQYQAVLDMIDSFHDKEPYYLDTVSWDKLRSALKSVVYEVKLDDPVEKIKRSFLVELAADASGDKAPPSGDDSDGEDPDVAGPDVAGDAGKNNAESDDAEPPKMYYDMDLHESTRMLIEGYYNEAISKIKGSCTDPWLKQL